MDREEVIPTPTPPEGRGFRGERENEGTEEYVDYQAIINKYYGEDDSILKTILMKHSQSVAQRALQIVSHHPELHLDRQFVEEAAMLLDIGLCRCHAPSIECFGTADYILHGRMGAEILRKEGYPRHARVCERHTGAGLTREDIERQRQELIRTHSELVELQQKNRRLAVVNSMTSAENSEEATKRLNALIAQVDRAIAALKK